MAANKLSGPINWLSFPLAEFGPLCSFALPSKSYNKRNQMKQRLLLILLVAAVALNSCSNKGGKSGLMVPKDAAVVVHINSSSLSSKISWNEIKQANWFREMRTHSDDNDSLTQRLFDDPAN